MTGVRGAVLAARKALCIGLLMLPIGLSAVIPEGFQFIIR